MSNNNLIIYPNPSTGIFNIETKSNVAIHSVKVSNILGANVYTVSEKQFGTVIVDLTGNTNGVYFISVELADGQIHTQKLTLNK